jgi:hypothetical protein
MDGVGIRVREFNQVYDKKRHAPAVIAATITISRPCICSQPSPPIYIPQPLPFSVLPWRSYVIFKASKTEQRKWKRKSSGSSSLSL